VAGLYKGELFGVVGFKERSAGEKDLGIDDIELQGDTRDVGRGQVKKAFGDIEG